MTAFIFVVASNATEQAEACLSLHSEFSRPCLILKAVDVQEGIEIFMSSCGDPGDSAEISEKTSTFEGKKVIVVRKYDNHLFFFDDCPVD